MENCPYHVFLDSNKCSVHFREEVYNEHLLTNNEIFKEYDKIVEKEIINKLQEENILNLIKHLPKNNISKVVNIINVYLKTINKKYINANLGLKLQQIFNDSNNIHYIYPLVRDYWNITTNHLSSAICYYNPNFDNDYMILKERLKPPRLPFKCSFNAVN